MAAVPSSPMAPPLILVRVSGGGTSAAAVRRGDALNGGDAATNGQAGGQRPRADWAEPNGSTREAAEGQRHSMLGASETGARASHWEGVQQCR